MDQPPFVARYANDELDEVWASGSLHLESMSRRFATLMVYPADGSTWCVTLRATKRGRLKMSAEQYEEPGSRQRARNRMKSVLF